MRYYELTEAVTLSMPRSEAGQARLAAKSDEIKKGLTLIKKYCQPYLSQVKDPMKLRRGVSRDMEADPDTGRPMFNKKQAHLEDRWPRGGNMKEYSTLVNDYFTKEFGLPFRNGIMTTGDQLQSSGFGTDVAVFPIGEFKFLWSRQVTDLNYTISSWNMSWDDDAEFGGMEEQLIKAIGESNYQTTDLQAAIESKSEIMIWAEEYYTLDNNVSRELAKKLLK